VDPRLHHLQGEAESLSTTTTALADLIVEFLRERTALLMRHEDVAVFVTDYDINNAYQYIIAREQTHLSWLQHALLDLGAPIPGDPPRNTVPAAKGAEAWKSLAAEDARLNAQFVDNWRRRVEPISHARHRGMLNVILGEMLEHKRLFDQAAAGNTGLIGTSLSYNDHPGEVMAARWVE
jgi:hypothetical protein